MYNKIFRITLFVSMATFVACGQAPEETPASDTSTSTEEVTEESTETAEEPEEVEEEKLVSIEVYDAVNLGSTYEEAVEIVGSEGEVFTESGEGEFQTTIYKWENDDSSNLRLMFQNGSLITKYQTDLIEAADVELTKDKYESLDFGGSYESAVEILGVDGIEISSGSVAGQPERTEYEWKKSFEEKITLTFQDGGLITRSQTGVIKSEGADVSKEKYEQIADGMSYSAMVELFGGDGIEESKTVIPNITTTASYVWAKDDPFVRISVVFQDDQPISKNYVGPE